MQFCGTRKITLNYAMKWLVPMFTSKYFYELFQLCFSLNLFISSLQCINLQANKQKYEKGLEKKL